MDNQHRYIAGYRELSPEEVNLINDIKAMENQLGVLVKKVNHLPQTDQRWTSISRTHLQQGFMALIRSIAQPESEL